MKAAILGSTGYAGSMLLKLLAGHPEVTSLSAASSSRAGSRIVTELPHLSPTVESVAGPELVSVQAALAAGPDVVFSALPSLESSALLEPFFGHGVVIDLSADFRFQEPGLFQLAYGSPPPRPDLLAGAVYGLVEANREAIRGTDLIANPGCYPTAVLLPLVPLARGGLLGDGPVIATAMSGISGAGRKVAAPYLYCERAESTGSYLPGSTHRHHPEIATHLRSAGATGQLLLNPHYAPMKRGIACTTTATLAPGVGTAEVEAALRDAYADSPCIKLVPTPPQTGSVWASNRCDIAWQQEEGLVLLFSAIDNLMKGAAGQAVQNMNIRFGLPEAAGLPLSAEL